MTNQLHTHHLAMGALLGLLVAIIVPAALAVAFAFATLGGLSIGAGRRRPAMITR